MLGVDDVSWLVEGFFVGQVDRAQDQPPLERSHLFDLCLSVLLRIVSDLRLLKGFLRETMSALSFTI